MTTDASGQVEGPELLTSIENPPPAPPGLGPRGQAFWTGVTTRYELRVDELELLREACRVVGLIDYLADQLGGAPMTVAGSQGQSVAHPLLLELRSSRALLASLLRQLKLPDAIEEEQTPLVETPTTQRARKAAQARWSRERARNADLLAGGQRG